MLIPPHPVDTTRVIVDSPGRAANRGPTNVARPVRASHEFLSSRVITCAELSLATGTADECRSRKTGSVVIACPPTRPPALAMPAIFPGSRVANELADQERMDVVGRRFVLPSSGSQESTRGTSSTACVTVWRARPVARALPRWLPPALSPADYFEDLHPTQLPIANPHTSVVVDMVMNGAAGGLMLHGEVA